MSSRVKLGDLCSGNENMQNWKVSCNVFHFALLIIISFFLDLFRCIYYPTKAHDRFRKFIFRHFIISCHKIVFGTANVCRIVEHLVIEVSANLSNWPTDFVGQGPSRESDISTSTLEISRTWSSLPCSQERASGSYPDPYEPSPNYPILFFKTRFNFPPSATRSSQVISLGFLVKTTNAFPFPYIRATCPAHPILLYLSILIMFGNKYKLFSTTLCCFPWHPSTRKSWH